MYRSELKVNNMEIKKINLYDYFGVEKPESLTTGGVLTCYLREVSDEYSENKVRPAMLVIPGGGYGFCSDRENEPIALEFLSKGFNVFSLIYSIKGNSDVEYPYQLLEGCMAIAYIRENAEKFSVNSQQICSIGFSAGGHLCAMLATLTGEQVVKDFLKDKASLCRPDAVILSYPVITWGEYAHVGSFKNLCGQREDLFESLSLEKRVNKDSVPAFIWSTDEDASVPCENSLQMALAYRKAKVPMELHIFAKGQHGLSLATSEVKTPAPSVAVWIDLAITWLTSRGFVMKEKEN